VSAPAQRGARAPVGARDRERLLEEASALGIPWERILAEEIRAERTLREWLAENEDCPLRSAYWILPRSLLQSFRIRDLIAGLSWEASMGGRRDAARQLRSLLEHLSGKSSGHAAAGNGAATARHLWFGYHRILALQRICCAARKSRGDYETRLAMVCEATGCAPGDADWAIRRETSRNGHHALDDAMRRAREEGFELPTAESEVRAFRRLQRFVKSSAASGRAGRERKSRRLIE
jgi:hypothetical protein